VKVCNQNCNQYVHQGSKLTGSIANFTQFY